MPPSSASKLCFIATTAMVGSRSLILISPVMIAIHYSKVKTPAEEGKIFGLQVAIGDFLQSLFRYGSDEKFHVLIADKGAQEEVLEAAHAAVLDPSRLVFLDQRHGLINLTHFDVVFRTDPDTQRLLWQRHHSKGAQFAFCGLSHAMTGIEGGTVLEQYCLQPSRSSDAIVCPSEALARAIGNFWDQYGDYIEGHFGAKYRCPVRLPVIPLGINVSKIAARCSEQKRVEQRARLQIQDDEIILLWVGRLSYAIKAHPISMFQAAEKVCLLTGRKVHLVMQGYFIPDDAKDQFERLAKNVCHKAKVTFIASDDRNFPEGVWAAADIFLSLVDNVQESFGLTPLEAMAAGLPRVVSDWDGYRDCVDHGNDGFLVPTLLPPKGTGADLKNLLLTGRDVYGGFLAKTALTTAVDHEKAALAIKALIENPNLKRSIAEKASQRVEATYDWKHIIPRFEALWKELAAQRNFAQPCDPKLYAVDWPLVPDPYAMFETYPTRSLTGSDRLHLIAEEAQIAALLQDPTALFALDLMASASVIVDLLNYVSQQQGSRIVELLEKFASTEPAALWRTIGWLIKFGILKVAE